MIPVTRMSARQTVGIALIVFGLTLKGNLITKTGCAGSALKSETELVDEMNFVAITHGIYDHAPLSYILALVDEMR